MLRLEPPEIFGLLGDPLRWRLVTELARSDRRVGELVELVGKPQNLLSYHLAELRRAGIVSARRSSADGRDVYYRADLFRCLDLLGEAGRSLHPVLSLGPIEHATIRPRRVRPRLLFLCTGNSARSQIAEALVEQRSGSTLDARSAGSHPKTLHPMAVRVLAERGIDIADRRAKSIRRFTRNRFERVITLCDKVREICPEFPAAPLSVHWSIPDPAATVGTEAERYNAFEQVTDDIDRRISLLLAELQPLQRERQTA